MTPAERLARRFHEIYEELAPTFGWETQLASRTVWEDVPENNRELMVAVATRILDEFPLDAEQPREHVYPGVVAAERGGPAEFFASECANECGAFMDRFYAFAEDDDVDPYGECPGPRDSSSEDDEDEEDDDDAG